MSKELTKESVPAKGAAANAAKPVAKPVAKAVSQEAVTKSVASASPEVEEEAEDTGPGNRNFILFNAVPSWAISAVVHGILLIMLALWTVTVEEKKETVLVANHAGAEEIQDFKENLMEQIDVNTAISETTTTDVAAVVTDVVMENADVGFASDMEAAQASVDLVEVGLPSAQKSDLTKSIGAFKGSGIEGRGTAARAAAVAQGGGNAQSEAAVAEALRWLAAHQFPDGSWNFDHRGCPTCQGRCSHHGALNQNARNGATGLALLPFLGSGQTHKEGNYKETVKRGLYFLMHAMKNNKNGGGDLADAGTMYSHGICSIVLCEAYAMTRDKELMAPAQAALNHIVYAQDPVGGGWRYSPRQAGDTSAVGWQLMALKSGHMAYLNVPGHTITNAVKFLDSVQAESGAKYGYTGPGAGQATTAVGLLSRMYLGWKKENPALQRGVQYLSATGPSKGNMYYNYYATQVMRHNEGEEWTKWNKELRDWLIEKQDKNGHQKGSWNMAEGGDHGAMSGGRLYCTAMSTMILEVYYRHMPIYAKAAAEEDFPL